jgi:hypothetical protein
MVLLKVLLMCACPTATFFFSFLRIFAAGFPFPEAAAAGLVAIT